jgi:rare lipoprotein A
MRLTNCTVASARFDSRHDRRQSAAPRASLWLVTSLALLAGCISHPAPKPSPATAGMANIPDPIPKAEPRAALGNPPFYEVFGKRYFVLPTADGYVERGVASWYGPGFHKERTATGDPYDMYAMTAAHKTLPLPCYARVTNLKNGRSIIVRINDRGPFKNDRIVDLSYSAASKLDMIREGTALVELQVVGADGGPAPSTPTVTAALFVQAGAFGDEANALHLVERLRQAGYTSAFVRKDRQGAREIHRVRIGPVAGVAEFDRIVRELRLYGIDDARLASDN